MEAIGMGILWLFASIHVLTAVVSAFMVGKPKARPTYTNAEVYVSAGMAILFIYALVLLSAS